MLARGGCAAWRVALKSPPASPAGPVLLEGPSATACCEPEPVRGSLGTPEGRNGKHGQLEALKLESANCMECRLSRPTLTG